jgi:O-antigen/teichoic acid export membrane protein
MAQGGKVWNDREKLGVVLVTGLDLRRKFSIISLIFSIPILIYLLRHNQASWLATWMIVLALIPTFYAALSDSLLEIVPKLHQSILPLQKNQTFVAVIRLFSTALTLFIFPWAFVAILASGFARIHGNFRLLKITNNFIDKNQLPDIEVRKNILIMVKRILPGAVFFSLSGQITIWLISLFGNVASVAQLGALGRITMILTFFNVLIGMLIVPRFAKLNDDRDILLNYFSRILTLLFLFMLLIVGFVYVFSSQILWVLGRGYSHLHVELLLSISTSCLSLIAGVVFVLCTARGWVISPVLSVTINFCAMLFFIIVNNVNTLQGVLLFSFEVALALFVVNIIYCFKKILGKNVRTSF